MITSDQVYQALQRWENAGLIPPVSITKAPTRVVEAFMERFRFMEEKTLDYVTSKVIMGSTWPTYGVIEQLAREYQESNSTYVYIDYFKELRKKAYGENETFDEFVQRVAEKYFPGRGEKWRKCFAFTLHYYGICCNTCAHCDGNCPHNGHQYHLRIKKGTANPVPWASLELCEKFKVSVDAEGRHGQSLKQ